METITPMTAQQLALSRAIAYSLLSDLFLNGITASTLPLIRQVEVLNKALPSTGDFEQLGALHYQLFGLNLFPFESAFLSEDGMLGGEISERVMGFYHNVGRPLPTAVSEPDHIGWELYTLAFLCGAEADAWQDRRPETAMLMQEHQNRLLDNHLLRWIRPFTVAVHQHNEPFFSTCAALLWELICEHAAEKWPAFDLPTPPDVLTDKNTTTRDIVRVLIRPSFSGWFLTRHDITQLSRQLNVPHGFGSRSQMLSNLLRAAGQYNAMPDLLTNLLGRVDEWESAYRALGKINPDPWLAQLQNTRLMLKQMRQQLPCE